jgi:penicillin-binding protein 1C
VPFTAVSVADTKTIHWFVSQEYLGSSEGGKAFFWTPKPGKFLVRAVDDHGRSAVREVVTKIVE